MADMLVENLAAMMVAQTVAKTAAMSVELQVDVSAEKSVSLTAAKSETCAAFQMADKWGRDVAASSDVVLAGSMEPCTAVGTG